MLVATGGIELETQARSQSLRSARIKSSEFAVSILGGEFPFDGTGLGIALADIGVDFEAQGRLIGNSPRNTRIGKNGQFDLSNVEPAAVLWDVVGPEKPLKPA